LRNLIKLKTVGGGGVGGGVGADGEQQYNYLV